MCKNDANIYDSDLPIINRMMPNAHSAKAVVR